MKKKWLKENSNKKDLFQENSNYFVGEIECSHIFSIMFCGNERGGEEDIGYFLFCENLLLFRHFGGGWFRDFFL